jgi:uncharacterized membrane protein
MIDTRGCVHKRSAYRRSRSADTARALIIICIIVLVYYIIHISFVQSTNILSQCLTSCTYNV